MMRRIVLSLIALAAAALVFAPYAHAQTVRATRTRNVVEDAACSPATGWETRPERYTSASAATAAARVKKTCPVVPPVDTVPTPPVDTVPTPPPVVVPPAGPVCGLASAAFCDTFDAPSVIRGRAGELDASKWAVSRTTPAGPSNNGAAFAVGPATLGPCRANITGPVFPPNDIAICDGGKVVIGTGAQNYGQTAARIRQPFDVTGRTGTLVFDAEANFLSGLHGWVSLAITEDPAPAPNFVLTAINDEGGAIPRNALEIQFRRGCGAGTVGVQFVGVFRDYVLTPIDATAMPCVAAAEGKLNRFKVSLSQTRLVVQGTATSADGSTFGPFVTLFDGPVTLPFAAGYVHLSVHNHATRKYSPGYGSAIYRDAWVARWDNVGFDGPVRRESREYEIPDALVAGTNAENQPGPVVSVGYRVGDESTGPKQLLTFKSVDLTGMGKARIALAAWYLTAQSFWTLPQEQSALLYRLNRGAWRVRLFTPAEIALLRAATAQGQLSQIIDVPFSDLRSGDNTLEFTTRGVPQPYAPLVSAIDLILSPASGPIVVPPPVDTQPTPPPVVTPPVGANQLANVPSMVGMYGQPAVWNVQAPGKGAVGSSVMEFGPTSDFGTSEPGRGDFRTVCEFVKTGVFDPLVFPGKDVVGHPHLFFGNTGINPSSTTASLIASGNSTCYGGTANRSAYWVPMMYRPADGSVVPVSQSIIYYKTSYGDEPTLVQPIPAGLHIIAGDKNGTGWQGGAPYFRIHWLCRDGSAGEPMDGTIAPCAAGDMVQLWVAFPQCWNGRDLDSPDHTSHMAYLIYNGSGARGTSKCPATHPVLLPQLTEIFQWAVAAGDSPSRWRLVSDMGAQKPGQSAHADYMIAWDDATMRGFVKNCLNAMKNCQVNLLGDGRRFRYLGSDFWQ